MIVADMVDREHGAVLLGVSPFRPKAGKICRPLGRHAQHHHRGALVVINQRPEFTARVSKGPFRYNIFSWFRVALRSAVDECFLKGTWQRIAVRIVRQVIYRFAELSTFSALIDLKSEIIVLCPIMDYTIPHK